MMHLLKAGIFRCKSIVIPLDPNSNLMPDRREALHDVGRNKMIFMKLNCVTMDPPYISYQGVSSISTCQILGLDIKMLL